MSAVLPQLDAEWARLAPSNEARRAIMRWTATSPALTGLNDFDDLLARRRDDPDTAQEVLAALAALAPDDELAVRVLLQALVPGLIRLSTTAGYDDREALDHMVALAWERIRTYPRTRQGDVAANVLRDVRKRYREDREIDTPRKRHQRDWRLPTVEDSDDAVAERIASVPSAEETALQHAVLAELVVAQRNGVLSEPVLRLILETRCFGYSLSDVAARSGLNRNTLQSWRFRAERRLRELPLAG